MKRRLAAAACALLIGCALTAGGALLAGGAASGAPAKVLRVETIDGRGDRWSVTGVATAGAPKLTVDGRAVEADVQQPPATDVVVVIDNDRALGNGTVQLASQAARSMLEASGTAVREVGVVTTGTQGAVTETPLGPQSAAASALGAVQQVGDSAPWDALFRAARLLQSSDAASKRVVAFLAAPDKLSRNTANSAQSALRVADARLDAVVLPSGVDTGALVDMVSQLGGSFQSVTADDSLAAAGTGLAEQLDGQFRATFPAPGGDSELVPVGVRAGSTASEVEAVRGSVAVGAAGLEAVTAAPGLLERLLSNPLVRLLAVLLLAAAVVGLVWSLLSLVVPDDDSLSRRLRAYDESAQPDDEEDQEGPVGMATVPLLQRAVALTGEVADKRGALEKLETTLERANLPLRAAEALFFVSAASVLLGLLVVAVTRNPILALAAIALAFMVPKSVLNMRVRGRQKKFVNQLPDMLSLLAGTLKAGYSITQGFEAVSKEVDDPMGRELRRVVTEHRLGRTLEDALDATAERMGSDDFAWTVMAIKIQREVGGNLAELLLTVANTMTQRERLRRDVATLTAEGRMSALILGLLPPGLAVVMYFMNRDYIMLLFRPGLGYVMLGLAGIAMAIGFVWMKKIITIEV